MQLLTAKNYYITRSRQIIDDTEKLSIDSYGFREIFTRTKLRKHKSRLAQYYDWLREYDEAYSKELSIDVKYEDLKIIQARAEVVRQARELFVSSLSHFESELSNIESSHNFRLTTSIAILALVVSIFF